MKDYGVSQHKRMAYGDNVLTDDTFGVQGFASMQGKVGPETKTKGHLGDADRSAGPPLEGNQRNPHFGDHRE